MKRLGVAAALLVLASTAQAQATDCPAATAGNSAQNAARRLSEGDGHLQVSRAAARHDDRRRQLDHGIGRRARRTSALHGRGVARRCGSGRCRSSRPPMPAHPPRANLAAPAEQESDRRTAGGRRRARHLQGSATWSDERRRHRSAGERRVRADVTVNTAPISHRPRRRTSRSAVAFASACSRSRCSFPGSRSASFSAACPRRRSPASTARLGSIAR